MPPSRTTSTPSTTTGTDALLYLLIAVAALGFGGGSLAWFFGNVANVAIGTDPWASYVPAESLLHPDQVWPHLPRPAVIAVCYVLPTLMLLAAALLGAKAWLRLHGRPNGLADQRALADLLPKKSAAKAIGLRPSLNDTKPKNVAPDDRGVLLGTLPASAHEVRSSWEDVIVAIMAPRSGKTSGLAIPAILHAPGPVLLTSNKAAHDAFTATATARAEVGTVWTFDPQQIAHAPQEVWWDILADAHDLTGARRLAGHFVTASVNESSAGDFWSTAAANTLTALFLAAARGQRPITDVLAWLASPADRTPIDLLQDAGLDAVAAQLHGTVSRRGRDPRRHLRNRPPVRQLPPQPVHRRLGHPAQQPWEGAGVQAGGLRHQQGHAVPAVQGRRRIRLGDHRRCRRRGDAHRRHPGRARRRTARRPHAGDP